MTVLRLRGKLPSGDFNGLTAKAADEFLRDPSEMRLCLALLDVKQVIDDQDEEEQIVVLRIKRIEAVTGDDLPTMQRIMMRAHEQRTGQQVLPFETEQEMAEVFGDWAREAIDESENDDEEGGDE